jgi:hypothetical protein
MNASQLEQFEKFTEQFLESEEWLPYHTTQNLRLVVERAITRVEAAGGYPSYAALELSAADLISAKIIRKQFERTEQEEAASRPVRPIALTVAEYRSLPSAVLQRRYRQEPAFKLACDALFASGQV